ncbi:hypothetical protein J6590_073298 [Homalodisca vitripennis]|nr:hypothetical protein J6590_073298 [Homalodisca vitripennis]
MIAGLSCRAHDVTICDLTAVKVRGGPEAGVPERRCGSQGVGRGSAEHLGPLMNVAIIVYWHGPARENVTPCTSHVTKHSSCLRSLELDHPWNFSGTSKDEPEGGSPGPHIDSTTRRYTACRQHRSEIRTMPMFDIPQFCSLLHRYRFQVFPWLNPADGNESQTEVLSGKSAGAYAAVSAYVTGLSKRLQKLLREIGSLVDVDAIANAVQASLFVPGLTAPNFI